MANTATPTAATDQQYGTIVTDAGLALVTDAMMEGEQVNLTTFAVGDGGGAYYVPDRDMTALKNQVWQGDVNNVEINAESRNMIDITAIIPPDAGGFTIREMGIFTDGGVLFAVCNTPDMEKVVITTGAGGEIELIMHIELSNTEAVSFIIDPNVVMASKKDIENHNTDPEAHAEKFAALPVTHVSEEEPDWKPGDHWVQIVGTREGDDPGDDFDPDDPDIDE